MLFMDEKKLENNINLDVSVSEQIADMQLMFLRQAALSRVLSYDEIKTLEILSKVKNVEVEKRQPPKEEDPKKTRAKKLTALARENVLSLPESKKDETSTTISKPNGIASGNSEIS